MLRAVVCRALGAPETLRLETSERAPLAAGQARVAVHAAGLNFPDIMMVAGDYQLKPPLPFTPGMEAAGEIVEVAGDDGLKVGDRVIVKARFGCFADEMVVTRDQLVPIPKTFDFAQGATFLAAHGTAYHALVDRAQIRAGETLLVHGAGGGVGLAAVELGKVLGATVIACASSEEKLDAAKHKGAAHGVLYGREPFRDAVKRITDGRGVDVVFDPVGGEIFEQSLRCVAWGARLLVVGFTGGIGNAATNLVLIKGASVLGVRAGEAVRQNPTLGIARQAMLMRLVEEKRIAPHVSHRLPLVECARAMRLLMERKAIGRVVLMMR